MKGCAQARQRLALAADGQLSLDERLRLDAHLERCVACRAERDALDALEAALLDLPEPPLASLALDGAVAGICARIDGPDRAAEAIELDVVPGRAVPGRLVPGRPVPGRLVDGEPKPASVPRRVALALAGLAAAVLLAWLGWIGRGASAPIQVVSGDGAPGPGNGELVLGPRAPAASGATVSADAVDPARLEAARAAVADALGRSFAGVLLLGAPEEIEAAVRDFEARTGELARDWPVLRIAQGLSAHPDDAIAGPAVRLLGARGDALSAHVLRDALDRPALAAAAVLALGDLGRDGLSGLAEALRRPELAGLARDHVVAIGGERAVGVLAEALRRMPAEDPEARAMLDALVAIEPCPAGAVLDLIKDGVIDAAAGHRALAATSAAGEALLALVRAGRRSPLELLGALAVVRPGRALPWIAAQATDRDVRDAAFECLAAYADADALDVLRDLHARGRGPRKLVLASVKRLLDAAPDAAVDLARRGANGDGLGDSSESALRAHELLDLLLDVGGPSAARGMAALAFQSALDDDDRPWAALAVGELGGRSDVDLLAEGVSRLGPDRELLAAAALLAATALGRPQPVLFALDERGRLDHAHADSIVALCESARDAGTSAVTLFKVARELRPHFDDPNPKADLQ